MTAIFIIPNNTTRFIGINLLNASPDTIIISKLTTISRMEYLSHTLRSTDSFNVMEILKQLLYFFVPKPNESQPNDPVNTAYHDSFFQVTNDESSCCHQTFSGDKFADIPLKEAEQFRYFHIITWFHKRGIFRQLQCPTAT